MNFGMHVTFIVLVACLQVTASEDLTPDTKPGFLLTALCTVRGRVLQDCMNELQSRMFQKLYPSDSYRKRMQSPASEVRSVKIGLPNKRRRDEVEGFYSNW